MGRDPIVALPKSVTKNVDAYAKDEGLESRSAALRHPITTGPCSNNATR